MRPDDPAFVSVAGAGWLMGCVLLGAGVGHLLKRRRR